MDKLPAVCRCEFRLHPMEQCPVDCDCECHEEDKLENYLDSLPRWVIVSALVALLVFVFLMIPIVYGGG